MADVPRASWKRTAGRAAIELPARPRAERWVLTEEAGRYRRGLRGRARPTPSSDGRRRRSILGRFLRHARPGRPGRRAGPLSVRAGLGAATAGGVVAQRPAGPCRDAAGAGAAAVVGAGQPGAGAARHAGDLRREVITCPPPQFADFVAALAARPSGHAPRRARTASAKCWPGCRRLPLPAELWEQTVLPARVRDYQPRWLDEAVASGRWTWTCGHGERGTADLAFFGRERLATLPPWRRPSCRRACAEAVLRRAAHAGRPVHRRPGRRNCKPRRARCARRLVVAAAGAGDERPVRRGPAPRSRSPRTPSRDSGRGERWFPFSRNRGGVAQRSIPEGRWSLLAWGRPDAEAAAFVQAPAAARSLRHRRPRAGAARRVDAGVADPVRGAESDGAGAARCGAATSSRACPGRSSPLPEAARELQNQAPPPRRRPGVLLHSLDPANLYGSGAPLDVPLLDGGTPRLLAAGRQLAGRAGGPAGAARRTARPAADGAAQRRHRGRRGGRGACRPCSTADRQHDVRHKLTVETWNGQPVTTTEGKELLEGAGFVRDYQGMTLYAAWR